MYGQQNNVATAYNAFADLISVAMFCSCRTYINCSVAENLVRNVDWSCTVTAADWNDAVSFITAKRKEDLRYRAVSETLTTIKPQQQQQQQLW